jgi:hypothetical protein
VGTRTGRRAADVWSELMIPSEQVGMQLILQRTGDIQEMVLCSGGSVGYANDL